MKRALRHLWHKVAAYAAHDDPLVGACNTISLVVASNQPFYPLYVYWSVSGHVTPTFFTFLSTPFFLAVPAIARRWPLLGRAMLPLVGIANTALSIWAFGSASGVAIFLIPCGLIGAAFLRPSERVTSICLIGLAVAVYLLFGEYVDGPVHPYSPAEYQAFVRLNAISAGMLVVFVGLLLSNLIAERREQATTQP